MPVKRRPISLYIHIPFCSKRCPYCAFFKLTETDQLEAFVNSLIAEMAYYAPLLQGHFIKTIFFGGGTPNFLPKEAYERIFEALHTHFEMRDCSEITMEMNPERVEESFCRTLKKLGLTRVSLGIQSFQEKALTRLGRAHTKQHIDRAISTLKIVGLSNFNLDLIFGVPEISIDMVKADIEQALLYEPTHLSTYALTIETGTEFAKKGVKPAADDSALAQYEWIRKRVGKAGFQHYEVSAFAKPGFECAHNLVYWTQQEYIGLGPSGSSYWGGRYYKNPNDLTLYVQDPSAYPRKALAKPELSLEDQLKDYIVSGLRTRRGISFKETQRRFGISFETVFAGPLSEARSQRWVSLRNGRVLPTLKGLRVLDGVTELFML